MLAADRRDDQLRFGPGAAPDWTATIRRGIGAQPAVSAAGDVDGDGRSDLLVASMTPDAEGGRAELYLGGWTGPAASPAWRWEGHDRWRKGGFALAGGWLELAAAGDVDGDGRGDLVVGEPNWLGGPDEGPQVWGRVMVYEDALSGARPHRLW